MFWDSSALVPLLLPEARSAAMTSLLVSDRAPALWWASPVDCQSAIRRRQRGSPTLSSQLVDQALARLEALTEDLDTVEPSDDIRRRAARLVPRSGP